MQVRFALEPLHKSIFLAGPTPRSSAVASWRPQALEILERLGFEGTVFVPESANWLSHDDYDSQVHWEWEALNQATVVAFWIPRDMDRLPGFTTNIELGLLATSGKVLLGYPTGAIKMRYPEALARRFGTAVHGSLETLLAAAVRRTQESFGAARVA